MSFKKKLFALATNQKYEEIKKMVAEGSEINVSNEYNYNLLHIVSKQPKGYTIIPFLIAQGLDINQQDNLTKDTPLIVAANYQLLENVKALLSYPLEINSINSESFSALNYAVYNEHQEITEILLAHDANINVHNKKYRKYKKVGNVCKKLLLAVMVLHHFPYTTLTRSAPPGRS